MIQDGYDDWVQSSDLLRRRGATHRDLGDNNEQQPRPDHRRRSGGGGGARPAGAGGRCAETVRTTTAFPAGSPELFEGTLK